MKRILSLLFAVGLSFAACFAQSSREAISADPQKHSGTFYVYDYRTEKPVTAAPDGYKPFYISHFARHGARYCTSEYDTVSSWLSHAEAAGALSDYGKEFAERFRSFYSEVGLHNGNLTGIGKDQHRSIAARMFRNYPEVFEGPTHVDASSTESNRVIMSMWSCLSALKDLDRSLDVDADASNSFCSWLQTMLSSNPYGIKGRRQYTKAAEKDFESYFKENVPWKEIVGRFLTDEDAVKNVLKTTPRKFIKTLYSLSCNTYCLDRDHGCFDDLFSDEEFYSIWRAEAARFFVFAGDYEKSNSLSKDYAAFTLEQIIQAADVDIASSATQLRLRFGHDSGIAPLMVFMNLNGTGRSTSSLDEAAEILPTYNIPMGCNLQFIFYRNAEGNVIFKVLLNEEEASLPIRAIQGPYYSWKSFKEYYLPLIEASKEKIEAERRNYTDAPLDILKATDWNWRKVGKSSVEVGSASVRVFKSVQSISLVRFPMKKHSVSVVEQGGPDAAITSRMAEDNKALAAINGSYFNVKTLYPVTYVKDEGKVLWPSIEDYLDRSNGMFRIKDRKGREVDILSVDSLGVADAGKDWREAIVGGPVLIEEGRTLSYSPSSSEADFVVDPDYYKSFFKKRHPRTFMGYTKDGMMYFVVVDGRFPARGEGMSIAELQTLSEALGLYESINLDGGGSATLWSSDEGVVSHPYDNKLFDNAGERVVPNIIIVR